MCDPELVSDVRLLKQSLDHLSDDVRDIKEQLRNGNQMFVRREVLDVRLKPIQMVVFGLVGLILTSVVGGLLTLLMTGPIRYGG